jgi:hypothetical protein
VSDEFDWSNSPDVVLPKCMATAIYRNYLDDIVIRQEGFDGEDDRVILIPKGRAREFLEAFQAALGE